MSELTIDVPMDPPAILLPNAKRNAKNAHNHAEICYNWGNEIRNAPGDVGTSRGLAPSVRSTSMQHNDTAPAVPYGYCQCGCGQQTPIAKVTIRSKGHVKGEPLSYVLGHRGSLAEKGERRPDGTWVVFLTRGLVAVVDDCDVRRVLRAKWHAHVSKSNRMPYARAKINGKNVLLHRFILDVTDEQMVDHINGNTLDNRRANLRICTAQENTWNSRVREGREYKGVYREKNRWRVMIVTVNGLKTVGWFDDATEAARAYDTAAREVHGDFAWLNFPEDAS